MAATDRNENEVKKMSLKIVNVALKAFALEKLAAKARDEGSVTKENYEGLVGVQTPEQRRVEEAKWRARAKQLRSELKAAREANKR